MKLNQFQDHLTEVLDKKYEWHINEDPPGIKHLINEYVFDIGSTKYAVRVQRSMGFGGNRIRELIIGRLSGKKMAKLTSVPNIAMFAATIADIITYHFKHSKESTTIKGLMFGLPEDTFKKMGKFLGKVINKKLLGFAEQVKTTYSGKDGINYTYIIRKGQDYAKLFNGKHIDQEAFNKSVEDYKAQEEEETPVEEPAAPEPKDVPTKKVSVLDKVTKLAGDVLIVGAQKNYVTITKAWMSLSVADKIKVINALQHGDKVRFVSVLFEDQETPHYTSTLVEEDSILAVFDYVFKELKSAAETGDDDGYHIVWPLTMINATSLPYWNAISSIQGAAHYSDVQELVTKYKAKKSGSESDFTNGGAETLTVKFTDWDTLTSTQQDEGIISKLPKPMGIRSVIEVNDDGKIHYVESPFHDPWNGIYIKAKALKGLLSKHLYNNASVTLSLVGASITDTEYYKKLKTKGIEHQTIEDMVAHLKTTSLSMLAPVAETMADRYKAFASKYNLAASDMSIEKFHVRVNLESLSNESASFFEELDGIGIQNFPSTNLTVAYVYESGKAGNFGDKHWFPQSLVTAGGYGKKSVGPTLLNTVGFDSTTDTLSLFIPMTANADIESSTDFGSYIDGAKEYASLGALGEYLNSVGNTDTSTAYDRVLEIISKNNISVGTLSVNSEYALVDVEAWYKQSTMVKAQLSEAINPLGNVVQYAITGYNLSNNDDNLYWTMTNSTNIRNGLDNIYTALGKQLDWNDISVGVYLPLTDDLAISSTNVIDSFKSLSDHIDVSTAQEFIDYLKGEATGSTPTVTATDPNGIKNGDKVEIIGVTGSSKAPKGSFAKVVYVVGDTVPNISGIPTKFHGKTDMYVIAPAAHEDKLVAVEPGMIKKVSEAEYKIGTQKSMESGSYNATNPPPSTNKPMLDTNPQASFLEETVKLGPMTVNMAHGVTGILDTIKDFESMIGKMTVDNVFKMSSTMAEAADSKLVALGEKWFYSDEHAHLIPDVKKGNITPEEHNAVYSYTQSGYQTINKGLRKNTLSGDAEEKVKQIDKVFEKMGQRYHKDMVVYRGASVNEQELLAMASGGYSEQSAYTSTSYGTQTAKSFTGVGGGIASWIKGTRGKELKGYGFDSSQGSKIFYNITRLDRCLALFAREISHYGHEKEIILNRGVVFKMKPGDQPIKLGNRLNHSDGGLYTANVVIAGENPNDLKESVEKRTYSDMIMETKLLRLGALAAMGFYLKSIADDAKAERDARNERLNGKKDN